MRPVAFVRVALASFLVLASGAGCGSHTAAPAPLPLEQLPAALEQAFSQPPGPSKELAGEIVVALRAQDYAKAYAGLQTLTTRPNLTKDQTRVTNRGMLTLNQVLQSAQAQGDQKAAETLRDYRSNK